MPFPSAPPPPPPLRVTVWCEGRAERLDPEVAKRYPRGMGGAVAEAVEQHLGERVLVRTAELDEPDHGLTEEALAATDVLTWWGNLAHREVSDAVVGRVHRGVLAGMGLVVLHSGHLSKIFRRLMGTSCTLRWRNAAERELVWTVDPTHPVAAGVPHPLVIEEQETYGEFFDIPEPEELVFVSSFDGGEVFRSGCAFRRGKGRIFYFSPGDQEYPVYHHPHVRRVIANAVAWAAPATDREQPRLTHVESGWFEHTGGAA
ncbi:Trehalose utilization protein [Streptomyces zhaozhouensis]|uniref:Trehalose utilization protein n=1 Tax=Streptomyces zhaozhouensis TaxID=1300267 RepID=A0A286DTN9_9ACTN|nr:ThuA domain-containing protein [Streptomyces zhaozhouensis]SOD62057.1 Trehalose utilization protein [Streptomyces zhaozhouensis]